MILAFLLACRDPEPSPPRESAPDSAPDSAQDSAPPEDPAPDPACTRLGCLRAVESLGTWTRAELAPWVDPAVHLENGYEVLVVEYLSEAGPSTGTFTLPVDLEGTPPEDGFPVVVNAHGTIGLEDPCRLSGTVSGSGLAGLFGARGAIGVAPDYPGLGGPGRHLYLDARSEGTSVLDAIRAASNLASWRGVAASGRSAVVGLSQGGHAALAAAAIHAEYAPELDIRAFGVSGPAAVWHEHWAASIDLAGPHLPMHAMLSASFAEAEGESLDDAWAPGLEGQIQELLDTRCMWSPTFTSEPLLGDAISTQPEEVFSAAYRAAFKSGTWGQWSAVGEAFDENRVEPWPEQTAPIAIWQGSADTTVLPWMTAELVEALQQGGIEVDLHVVVGGTHTTTAFGFLATPEAATEESVAWIREQLAR